MRKFAKFIMITLAGIILSLLLIETSTLLRKLFTEPPSSWQSNLTDFKETEFMSPKRDLQPVKGSSTSTFTLASEQQTSNEKKYQRIKTETPLFKTTSDTNKSPSNILFMLPPSYFVKIIKEVTLESGDQGYYVRYSTYEGYASKSAFSGAMSDISTTQSGIKISLSSDAGTYLRETPEITDTNKTILIEKGTNGIILIGKTYGDTPSDGNTNEWYFVEYSTGPTTTYTGYIYAERCILEKPLDSLVLESDKIQSEEETKSETLSGTSIETPSTEPSFENALENNKLLWVVCIVFTIPVVLIFVMIIKKPKHIDFPEDNENDESITTSGFAFDEQISPQILKNEGTQLKFKSNNLDDLSHFVKPNISLEVSEEYNRAERQKPTNNSSIDNYYSITKTTAPQRFHTANAKAPKARPILENESHPLNAEYSPNERNFPLSHLNDFINGSDSKGLFTNEPQKKSWSISKMIKKLTTRQTLSKRVSKNRTRDAFHPGVVAGDDHFEFADSFELTTPINNHYIFAKGKTKELTKRQGKRLNERH